MLWFFEGSPSWANIKERSKEGWFLGIFFPCCCLWNLSFTVKHRLCWSHRQITQFLHPSHLASHSLPQYASRERTHLNKMSHLCVMWQSAQVPDISQAFVTRDVWFRENNSRPLIEREFNQGFLESTWSVQDHRMNLRMRRLLFDATGRLISVIL